MAIYFVRHGKEEDGFRRGWSKRGLIKKGFKQSKLLGQYLKSIVIPFTFIISFQLI